jgi:PTS system nitrogen regulatory IIA component
VLTGEPAGLADLLGPDRIIPSLRAADKAHLLAELARRAGAAAGGDAGSIEQALVAREALGSTGVGKGIAIPHARVPFLHRAFALFARLERPLDFAAIDGQPIDLVFLLLSPLDEGGTHLASLAAVSRRLRDPRAAAALRATRDARAIREQLIGGAPGAA